MRLCDWLMPHQSPPLPCSCPHSVSYQSNASNFSYSASFCPETFQPFISAARSLLCQLTVNPAPLTSPMSPVCETWNVARSHPHLRRGCRAGKIQFLGGRPGDLMNAYLSLKAYWVHQCHRHSKKKLWVDQKMCSER